MIALLQQIGMLFHKNDPHPAPVDLAPDQRLECDGRLRRSILVTHPLLEPTTRDWNKLGDFVGGYSSGTEAGSFNIENSKFLDVADYDAALNDMGRGRLEFLKLAIPHVKPRFAFAGNVWDEHDLTSQVIEACGLTRLFWVTYFGRHYVEHFGREFFFNIPAWRVEELDGGILLTVTESFGDFTGDTLNSTLNYLKPTFKNIRPHGRQVVIRGVGCSFYGCRAIDQGPQFNRSMIAILKGMGVVFYKAAPYPPPVEPDPERELEPDGQIVGFSIDASHPVIEPTNPSWNAEGKFFGGYSSTRPGWFEMGKGHLREDFPDYEEALQDMASGRREFLKLLIPLVKPDLAQADDVWDDGITPEKIAAVNLRKLYWVTYFGPHFVEHHGRDFFLNIPAWSVEELEDGFLVTVTQTFLEFAENEPKQTLKYLKQKFKNIRPNRFRIHPAF